MKMNLREAEMNQLLRLDRLGLKRIIVHNKEPNTPNERYQSETIVYLVGKDYDGRNEELSEALVSTGVSYCSVKDQWNKRKGRVIATERAIQNLKE